MHVLTKIFIVLVSLLAVLLVPLVVVYSYNENNFKARYQEAELGKASKDNQLQAALAKNGTDTNLFQVALSKLEADKGKLENEKSAADATVRQLESELATAKTMQAAIAADIAIIKSTVAAGQQLTETLITELRDLRSSAVAIEKQKVELDERLRDVSSQLEVAEQARRALAEELARLKDDHTKTVSQLGDAIQRGFIPGSKQSTNLGVYPDRTLTATILRVERSTGKALAEIDAGSTSGIKEGWLMSVSRAGSFVGKLRIINVDIKRSTGEISLEQPTLVQVGDTVTARAGEG